MVMVLGGEEELEYEVCIYRIHLEHVSEFKYLGCVLDESGKDEAEYSIEVLSGRRDAGVIRSLANAKTLQLEFARVLHESLLVPVLKYGSVIMICREKGRSVIKGCTDGQLQKSSGYQENG